VANWPTRHDTRKGLPVVGSVPGVDVVRGSAQLVGDLLEFASAPVLAPARWGTDYVLAGLLRLLGGVGSDDASVVELGEGAPSGLAAGQVLAGELLAGQGCYTRARVAERAGVSLEQARRLWRAAGFAEVDDESRVFTDVDVAALTDVATLTSAGLVDPDGAVALARPVGHLLSRLAAAQIGLVTEVVGEHLNSPLAAGETPEQAAARAAQFTQQLLPVLERTTLYVWRRHLATEAGRALIPTVQTDGELSAERAVGFVDISGYTRLSRGLDGPQLAALLERFETAAFDTVVGLGGRVVKTLGDEVLFIADTPGAAARIALGLLERTGQDQTLPQLHAGLAFGPVLARGGDVFGPVVNTAARIASLADRGSVRTDQATAEALAHDPQFVLTARAPRPVRGYPSLRSYRLRHR